MLLTVRGVPLCTPVFLLLRACFRAYNWHLFASNFCVSLFLQRELVYLRAVGKYRAGKLLEARRQLDELLKVGRSARCCLTWLRTQTKHTRTAQWAAHIVRSFIRC